MVKFYTIQQHLPTLTYEFQTNVKYCIQQTNFKYKIKVYYKGRNYTYTSYMNVLFYCVQQSNFKYKIRMLATSVLYIGCNCVIYVWLTSQTFANVYTRGYYFTSKLRMVDKHMCIAWIPYPAVDYIVYWNNRYKIHVHIKVDIGKILTCNKMLTLCAYMCIVR